MESPAVGNVLEYWNALRASRDLPDRSEIEPGAFSHALGDSFILELDAAGFAPYRIAGARLCSLFGHELRGLAFTAPFHGEEREEITRIIREVSTTRRPARISLIAESTDGRRAPFALMLMPLAHHGGQRGRMLGVLAPLVATNWAGTQRIHRLRIDDPRFMDNAETSAPALAPVSASPIEAPRAEKVASRFTVIQGGQS